MWGDVCKATIQTVLHKEICKFLIEVRMKGVVDAVMRCPIPTQDWGTPSSAAGGIGNCQLSSRGPFQDLALVEGKPLCPRVQALPPQSASSDWLVGRHRGRTHFVSLRTAWRAIPGPRVPRRINWEPLCGWHRSTISFSISSLPPLQPHRHHSPEDPYTKVSEFQGAQSCQVRCWSYVSLLIATSILSGFPWWLRW